MQAVAEITGTLGFIKMVDEAAQSRNRTNRGGKALRTMAGYILDKGQPWDVDPATSFPDKIRGRMKECFSNAMRTMIRHPRTYTYCEGYAISYMIPVYHAWLIDPAGRVVDVTWPSGTDYFGVAFTKKQVTDFMIRTECYGPMIDDWGSGWPLLRKGVDRG